MERIANHQSVQMKDRLMTRDISPFFWASSKGGIYQRALSGFCIQKKKVIHRITFLYVAERQGFEPWVRYNRTHDFQSCSFSRSDTSPCILLCNRYLYSI